MEHFTFESDAIRLPRGAWAKTHRRTLRWRGEEVLACTQGAFRPYLYPVYTPRGHAVTTESPADHPHHNSVWIAADHLHCRVPVGDGRHEEYTYNFYLNETFQGRAPGRIEEVRSETAEVGPAHFRIVQAHEWRGPAEWAAADGRVVAREARRIDVRPGEAFHVIDIRSELAPTEWDLTIGPTRHAFFSVRVAESMRTTHGGTVVDATGRHGGEAISDACPDWVDYSGPVGGGQRAGIAVLPRPGEGPTAWFVADWGVVTVGPFKQERRLVRPGEPVRLAYRLVVHDGDADAVDLPALHRAFLGESDARDPIRP